MAIPNQRGELSGDPSPFIGNKTDDIALSQRHGGPGQQSDEFVYISWGYVLLDRYGLPLPVQAFACEWSCNDLPCRDLLLNRPSCQCTDAEPRFNHLDDRFRQRNSGYTRWNDSSWAQDPLKHRTLFRTDIQDQILIGE